MTKDKFVQNVYDAAYTRLREIGKDDYTASFYARLLTAQGCLESAFGTKETGTYNYFGLKYA